MLVYQIVLLYVVILSFFIGEKNYPLDIVIQLISFDVDAN